MKISRFINAAILALSLDAVLIIAAISSAHATEVSIGGQRDANGCLTPAGYTWSAPMKKCIRTWEYYSVDAKSPSTGISKLDAFLQSRANHVIADFRENAETNIKEESLTGSTGYTLEISYAIVNTGSVVSVEMNYYENLGGVHGLSGVSVINYHVKSGKIISMGQVLGRAKLETVAKNIRTELVKQFQGGADDTWLLDGTNPKKAANYNNFALHTNTQGKVTSITIYFNE